MIDIWSCNLLSYLKQSVRCDMPRTSPYKIVLNADERLHLQQMARKYTSPYYEVVRAKAILMAAEGLENKEIGINRDSDHLIGNPLEH